jgi:hypothetical protein
LWAGLLPADLTLRDFKELFKAAFAVENHDKLMGELLNTTQKGLVGKYATDMMGYFTVLDLEEEACVRHFTCAVQKFGMKETIMACSRTSFLQAVKEAKEVEQAYKLGNNCPPLDGLNGNIKDQVVLAVKQGMSHFKALHWERDTWEERRPSTINQRHALLRGNQRGPMMDPGAQP